MIKITLTERFAYRTQVTQTKRAMFDFLKNAQESDIKFDGRFEKNFDITIDSKHYKIVLSVMSKRPAGYASAKGFYYPKERKIVIKTFLPRDFFTSREYYLNELKKLINHVVFHEFEHYLQFNTPGNNLYGDHLTAGDKYGKLHPILEPVFKDEFYSKEGISDFRRFYMKAEEIPAFLRTIFSFRTDNKLTYRKAFDYFEDKFMRDLSLELKLKFTLALLMYMEKRFPERYYKEKELNNYKESILGRINRFHEEARTNPKYKDKLRPLKLNINRG
jgi:hypothetical protein